MATTLYDLLPRDENFSATLRLIADGNFRISERWQRAGETDMLTARHDVHAL